MPKSINSIEAGIDWLTCTYALTSKADPIRDYFEELRIEATSQGYFEHPASNHGYNGWSVEGTSWLWSTKLNRGLAQFTSNNANERWYTLVHWLRETERPSVTRIDIQTTVWYSEDVESLVRELCEAALGARGSKTLPDIQLRLGNGGGDTLYIGKPNSDVYIRIYDKFRESKSEYYRNAIRYEVVLRNEYAHATAMELYEGEHLAEHIASRVQAYLIPHSIIVAPILLGAKKARIINDATDIERRVVWVKDTVASAIEPLIQIYGREYVLYLLKLEEKHNA